MVNSNEVMRRETRSAPTETGTFGQHFDSVAPLGLLRSETNALPPQYQGGAFISEHGNWDRSPLSGYEVVFAAFQQGRPVGVPEPVVTSFLSSDETPLYGLPVGLVQDKDGALLIADDVSNAVWRVTAKR